MRRRHRRLTAWLHGGSQLLVVPEAQTSPHHLLHLSFPTSEVMLSFYGTKYVEQVCRGHKWILLFDRGRNKQLFALHHILQLTQIAHIVDFPTKLKTVQEQRAEKIRQLMM